MFFLPRMCAYEGQQSLINGTSKPSYFKLFTQDPNQILDNGYSNPVDSLRAAVVLLLTMGLDFVLETLDYEPLYDGYSINCSEEELTIRI